LTGLKVKINLIPFNPWPGAPFSRPQDAAAEAFRDVLLEKNHTVIIRRSNGLSVDAACGQLVGRGRPASEPAGVLAAAEPS
jgi:23S rRNA (adenine2503-C2)-methyltransferase